MIEVRGGQASIWGAGALKRLEKSWPIASDVTAVYFHYVSYISVCTMLPTIKQRYVAIFIRNIKSTRNSIL